MTKLAAEAVSLGAIDRKTKDNRRKIEKQKKIEESRRKQKKTEENSRRSGRY